MSIVTREELETFDKWLPAMERCSTIKKSEYKSSFIYSLNTPSQFEIEPRVLKLINAEYDPHREKGGILMAQPSNIKKNVRYFKIIDVNFLENTVPEHEQHYRYRFEKDVFYKSAERCFTHTLKSPICYPIVFHTHPTFDMDDWEGMKMFFEQSRTSRADQQLADFPIVYRGKLLSLPNALVVINPRIPGQYFIGFFGGKIAPESFEDYMLALTGKSLKELYLAIRKWAGNNSGRIAFAISVSAFLFVHGMYHIEDVFPFIVLIFSLNIIPIARTMFEEGSHYFSQIIDKNASKKIFFPKFFSG